jgi:hypothetical protein
MDVIPSSSSALATAAANRGRGRGRGRGYADVSLQLNDGKISTAHATGTPLVTMSTRPSDTTTTATLHGGRGRGRARGVFGNSNSDARGRGRARPQSSSPSTNNNVNNNDSDITIRPRTDESSLSSNVSTRGTTTTVGSVSSRPKTASHRGRKNGRPLSATAPEFTISSSTSALAATAPPVLTNEQIAARDARAVILRSNLERQNEECEALSAIFGDLCRVSNTTTTTSASVGVDQKQPHIVINIPNDIAGRDDLILTVTLPREYPSDTMPSAYKVYADWLDDARLPTIHAALRDIYQTNGHEVVLFAWVEWLKANVQPHDVAPSISTTIGRASSPPMSSLSSSDVLAQALATHDDDERLSLLAISQQLAEDERNARVSHYDDEDNSLLSSTIEYKKPRAALASATKITVPAIISAEPFTISKSTFQAHIARVTSVEEAHAVLGKLLEDRKIARATHNISAYRLWDQQHNTFPQVSRCSHI